MCCVVRYDEQIQGEKLIKVMRDYNNLNSNEKVSRAMHKYRLAEEEQSEEVSGYQRGGVTPFLLKTSMPVVVSQNIQKLSPQFLWMGGGFKDVKISKNNFTKGISLKELLEKNDSKVIIGKITIPRTEGLDGKHH